MVCFWDDLWTDSELSQEYPRLASFAINGDISLMDAMQAEDLDSLFFHPLSQQAFEEFENLQAQLQLLMEMGIPIFHQVVVTIVVAENDTPIRLQIERSNPAILAPQLLWLSTKTQIQLTSPRRLPCLRNEEHK